MSNAIAPISSVSPSNLRGGMSLLYQNHKQNPSHIQSTESLKTTAEVNGKLADEVGFLTSKEARENQSFWTGDKAVDLIRGGKIDIMA